MGGAGYGEDPFPPGPGGRRQGTDRTHPGPAGPLRRDRHGGGGRRGRRPGGHGGPGGHRGGAGTAAPALAGVSLAGEPGAAAGSYRGLSGTVRDTGLQQPTSVRSAGVGGLRSSDLESRGRHRRARRGGGVRADPQRPDLHRRLYHPCGARRPAPRGRPGAGSTLVDSDPVSPHRCWLAGRGAVLGAERHRGGPGQRR